MQIKDCGLDHSSPMAAEEVKFIQVLCLRLSHEPSLVDFFIKVYSKSKVTFSGGIVF